MLGQPPAQRPAALDLAVWRQHAQQTLIRPAVRADRLHADMIRTCLPMLVDPFTNRFFIAPGNHRVNQSIRASSRKIRVRETQAPPVIHIVWQAQVHLQELTSQGTRLAPVLLQDRRLLDAEKFVRSKNFAGLTGMLRRNVIRVGAVRTLAELIRSAG